MFKNFNPFRIKSLAEIARQELLTAERDLLNAQSSRDYTSAMVTYHEQRVARLRRTLDSGKAA